ncbi:MAG TPA: glycosyl hydrolase family 18 protein [Bacteroidota bacterium]|nr:glycosyl hydrolase family 18 protein [Bacteroidota bacterium]
MRKPTMWIALLFSVFINFLNAQNSPWITAYYGGWSQGWFNNGVLPADLIDYSAVTHIIHFALVPQSDGTLDDQSNSVHPANAQALITEAHAAGKKVIICVGGAGSSDAFRSATSLLTLSTFIDNLVTLMTQRGYDGIDVDWEPLELTDLVEYTTFITALRARLDEISPRPLLTAATGGTQAPIFTLIANDFDQINLMTYDMSGAWPGWVPWHNAPLENGGFTFPSTGGPLPSADEYVNSLTTGGVPASKLGIGIDFYGYIWKGGSGTSTGGVTEPRQTYSRAPSVEANVPYYTLMQNYYNPDYYRWDSSAQASYLSIDKPGSANDEFISYDNEAACKAKIDYVKNKGIGGVIIWELGGGMLPEQFKNRDRLLQTIKMALQGDSSAPSTPSLSLPFDGMVSAPTTPTFAWNDTGLASWHRLQISTDSSFESPDVDESSIITSAYQGPALQTGQTYYWRVQGSNAFSASPWSDAHQFQTAFDTLPTPDWQYAANTGGYATLIIPDSVQPMIGTNPLGAGDFIGVFFYREDSLKCGGYTQWEPGHTMYIIVWQDNSLTSLKDGFSPGDSLYFEFDEKSSGNRFFATPTFISGNPTYMKDGVYTLGSLNSSSAVPVGPGGSIPETYYLDQNYPNPFNGSTIIEYGTPQESKITLELFNETGQRVKVLVDGVLPAGRHTFTFDSRQLSSGVYFYRLQEGNFTATKKMTIVK